MTHHCPECGAFSWHGAGTNHWALVCPACGHKARQHPHPPEPAMTTEHAIETLEAKHVGGGWYETPDGGRVRGRPDSAAGAASDAS